MGKGKKGTKMSLSQLAEFTEAKVAEPPAQPTASCFKPSPPLHTPDSGKPYWTNTNLLCSCDQPKLSVIDDNIGCDAESASVVIIGGGPHALAALAALQEGSPAAPQDGDAVCVIDPGSHFMQSWNTRFDALQIDHLRSPAFAHPKGFDPTALLNWAKSNGRAAEVIDAPTVDWLATTDFSEEGAKLQRLPSSALFRDFCASLAADLPHRWLCGTAARICKDESTGKYRVHYRPSGNQQRARSVTARAVILATGPIGKWSVPLPFEPHLTSRAVLHTEELLAESKGTLTEQITSRCPQAKSARVLVIGGGISAAQAALAAFKAGHQVVLRSRRPLQTRAFDIASEWLDVRTADRLRFEFLCMPMQRRREAIKEARAGGSVPANYMAELNKLAQANPTLLRLEVDANIDSSTVCVNERDGEEVVVNGEAFEMVILATGVVSAPSCSPLFRSVEEAFKAPTVDGLPRVDCRLRWLPNEDIFVLGANAVLELGPGGGNLMGAMRGARVVSNELRDLMWKHTIDRKPPPSRSIFTNAYAALGDQQRFAKRFGGKDDAEMDVLAQQLNLSAKAETALRKGRKDRKETRGLKGERNPLSFMHISVKESRAPYW